jgi:predicted dehydrogenase
MAKAKRKKTRGLKAGVIGYGGAFNMGRGHLLEMQKAGMEPTAVAELDESRLEVAREEFPGIETYTSVAQMLKQSDVNVIAIITPHNTHAKLALQCLKAGRHVVCEKPMAVTTAECDRMIREAEKQGVVLSTYHNRHWDGCIMEAVRQVKEKKVIGEVYRIEAHMGMRRLPGDWWRSSRSISGGILYDWGVHLLEYSLQILDGGLVEVSGFAHEGYWAGKTAWKDDTNEDEAFAVVRFDSGKWLTLCITSLDSNPKAGQLEITGTEGTYIMSGKEYEVITPSKDNEMVIRKGNNPQGEGWRFYQNVADHIDKGTKLVITPEWARRPIHVLDLASRSIEKGRAQKAKYA